MNIEELKRLAEAATPGPWEYQKDSKDFPVNGYVTVRDCIFSVCVLPYEGIRTDDRVTDNGLFIAAANPTAILELIRQRDELLAALKRIGEYSRVSDAGIIAAEVRRLREENERLADDMERCYRMLLSEPDVKGALFKAENILRESLADRGKR